MTEVHHDAAARLWMPSAPAGSHIVRLHEERRLRYLHWGARLTRERAATLPYVMEVATNFDGELAEEYPAEGGARFGVPALRLRHSDGSRTTRWDHTGRTVVRGLLNLVLGERFTPLELGPHHRLRDDCDAIERWAEMRHQGREDELVRVQRLAAARWSLPLLSDHRISHLIGGLSAENRSAREPLARAETVLISRLGITGRQANPWPAVDADEVGEDRGEVWSSAAARSGSRRVTAERTHSGEARSFGVGGAPEMADPDSDLYRADPDWALNEPGRPSAEPCNQLVLDFERPEISVWAHDWLDRLVRDHGLDHLKESMNRAVYAVINIAPDPDAGLWPLHGPYLQGLMGDGTSGSRRVDPRLGCGTRALGAHRRDLTEHVTDHRITQVPARFGRALDIRGLEKSRGAVHTDDGAAVSFETDRDTLGSLVVSHAGTGRKNRLGFPFDGPAGSYSFDQYGPELLRVGGRTRVTTVLHDPDLPSAHGDRYDPRSGQGHRAKAVTTASSRWSTRIRSGDRPRTEAGLEIARRTPAPLIVG
ncbi:MULTISPECIES: glycoside hydrolase family 36 N-terminal domain-containing protein [unclassified Streptomyces]|uniref:glycoside hydrolase family 36 N-terminal domain-containing protein n=1 Tax=unclassified Streptomyces TaxID=2593676 RepID=UPI0037F54E71